MCQAIHSAENTCPAPGLARGGCQSTNIPAETQHTHHCAGQLPQPCQSDDFVQLSFPRMAFSQVFTGFPGLHHFCLFYFKACLKIGRRGNPRCVSGGMRSVSNPKEEDVLSPCELAGGMWWQHQLTSICQEPSLPSPSLPLLSMIKSILRQ